MTVNRLRELTKENEILKKQLGIQINANRELNMAIYNLLGEGFKYENGKITPLSEMQKSSVDYEDIEIITGKAEIDNSLTHDEIRRNICRNTNLLARRINQLIRNQKKIIDKLKEME